jgi:hypothetical protein
MWSITSTEFSEQFVLFAKNKKLPGSDGETFALLMTGQALMDRLVQLYHLEDYTPLQARLIAGVRYELDVADLLERVRLLSKRQRKKVQFRTFGRFDLFIDEQPVQFSNAKAKELLAICVDRKGGIVKMEEAIDKLWENSPMSENVKAKYRKAVAYLNALFTEYKLPNIFISGYGSCYIAKEKVACDYYEFLESSDKPLFFGQYMHEYSWAEDTAAMLNMQMQQSKYQ